MFSIFAAYFSKIFLKKYLLRAASDACIRSLELNIDIQQDYL